MPYHSSFVIVTDPVILVFPTSHAGYAPCGLGQTCLNIQSDPMNCGGCGQTCSSAIANAAPDATFTCTNGVCSTDKCAAGDYAKFLGAYWLCLSWMWVIAHCLSHLDVVVMLVIG